MRRPLRRGARWVLDFTKGAGDGDMVLGRQVLVAKHEDKILKECPAQHADVYVAEFRGEIDSSNFGTNGRC